MRCIALINQKGGVGKTTTGVNLGACLAEAGRRVLLVDLDPQGNLSLHLGLELAPDEPSSYGILVGRERFADAIRPTNVERLSVIGTTIDLSGAELELATALGRETILRDAMDEWRREERETHGEEPVDYVLFDCPPSLGLLSINALTAASEIFLAVQTEFFALQGMSRLLELVDLVQRRLHRGLSVTGIVACLYDTRLKLAREVLAELRRHFPDQIFRTAIGTNVKLAEAPSFGQTILEYAPESNGARDYRSLASEVMAQEQPDATGATAATGAARAVREERPAAGHVLTPKRPPVPAPAATAATIAGTAAASPAVPAEETASEPSERPTTSAGAAAADAVRSAARPPEHD